ncbi:hypothetical protein ABT120_55510 [Nonomuraea angiospora]|uniref:hypothetical protein n=1 Tax=Nonomuraea angiospora TaxID=46172 RepID=UPI00331DDE36
MAINLEIADGWKLFGAGSDHGVPVSLRAEPPERLRDVIVPAGELTGTVQLRATLDDAATRLWLRYQLCGGPLCHPPAEVELPV